MMSFGLEGLVLSLAFSIALCVHAVRTHQEMFWLFIILLFQPLGGLVYLIAVVLPGLSRGTAVRKLGQATRETLDPMRDYRDARAAYDLTPTVHNQMRLAAAATELGRHEEAEALYREAMQGVHADDPALLLGRARALIELGRPQEALELLQRLKEQGPEAETPQAALAFARAYDGAGRTREAEAAYADAAPRVPGLEGIARQGAFFARTGRKAQAQEILAEIDRRLQRANPHFRREGRVWRDLVAHALAHG